jgi:D-3-phosphoglycerate dehydrogenase / 2-oxoglutarate reductase
MYKVLISDKLAQEGIDILNSIDGVEPVVNTGLSEDELCDIIGEYDGLIIRSATTVSEKVLAAAKKLKAVARAGVGVDNINIPEATRKGVIVMNTPGGNTTSAAEHTMALMLSLSRNVVPACNSLKAGAWDRKKYTGNQLCGKTLGVIGLGRIGMSVVKMALGFDMKIIGYDPFAVPEIAKEMGVQVVTDLNEIYKKADFISLHIPRNEQTTNMIGADQFKMMKPTARIINCARGGIINEADLYAALEAGQIAGAALDVFPKEPPTETGFTKYDNCLVTPHLGASTEEAQIEVAVEAAQIIADAIKGGPIRNSLNAPAVSAATPKVVTGYAELAQKIGRLMAATITGPVKSVQVAYRGSIAEKDVSPVTTAFSIGLLQANLDVPVNIVNVGLLAKERGITVDELKNAESKDIASSFTAQVTTDCVKRSITGTVYSEGVARIISIDGYMVEFSPQGPVMVIFNDDKPGVIGAVGTVCGQHGVNICTMGVGQKDEGTAVLAVSLDKQPGAEAVAQMKKLDFVNELYTCDLC